MSPLAALWTDWALTALWPIVGKSGLRLFSGTLFVHTGLVLGLLALAPWLALGGRWRRIVSPELRGPFAVLGFFGAGLPSFLLITALGYTSAANAAITAQIEVLYSTLLCAWLLKERVTAAQAGASLLVVAGTGLVVSRDLGTIQWKGDLIILLTPWMFQVSHIFAKRLPEDVDAVTISGARLFYGSLAMVPFTAWEILRGPRWSWTPEGAGLLLAQGVGMCAVNHVLWYMAIRRMDLAKTTGVMLSYPALTLVFSWALLREPVQAAQVAGLCLTFSGAWWLSQLAHRSQRPAAAML